MIIVIYINKFNILFFIYIFPIIDLVIIIVNVNFNIINLNVVDFSLS